VRRAELERLGMPLPVLPAIALGALPTGPDWALRLERLGLDVVASGVAEDTPETWAAARDAVPHRPVKATGGDPAALAAAGCRLVETARPVPGGVYRLGPDEDVAVGVDGADSALADPSDVAARLLAAVAERPAASVWAAATGLAEGSAGAAEERLRALVEGVRLARLYLAKEQFER
jgi:hypothetical protein